MYNLRRRIYESLPDAAKTPVGWIPFAWVAGSSYRKTMARCSKIDRASRDELVAFQDEALARMLRFVVDQVPAYQSLRSVVERLPAREAIKAFPLLDKAMVEEDPHRYLPRDFQRIPHYETTTGGTSGNQLSLFLEDDSQSIEIAFMHRQWARVGYTTRCRKATFRGVEFPGAAQGRYWQFNPIYNELQFSPFHMNQRTLPEFVERLKAWRPQYLHGYPSAISLLARFVLAERIPAATFSIRAVLLASEAVFPEQREEIEAAFATRAFSWYGHSERLILAGECEKTPVYHHLPDYGFCEIIDEAGNVVTREGDTGELVGTTFWNRAQPLIRYRTEDRARRLDHRCPCGRHFDRFDEVQGRWKQEYILGKNGSPISPAALNMHGSMFNNAVRYQFYQRQPGVVELRVMTRPGFGPKDVQSLLEAYRRKVGEELDVRVVPVDDIPLTARGKLRRLIQEISS